MKSLDLIRPVFSKTGRTDRFIKELYKKKHSISITAVGRTIPITSRQKDLDRTLPDRTIPDRTLPDGTVPNVKVPDEQF